MKTNIISILSVVFALSACDRTAIEASPSREAVYGNHPLPQTRTSVSTQTETGSTTQTEISTGVDTSVQTATTTRSSAVPDTNTSSQTETATATSVVVAVPLKIVSVTVDKVDALGHAAEDVRSFGIRFNEPAMDVELTVMSIDGSDFGHIVHHEYIAHSPESQYVSPGDWIEKLHSDTEYQWEVRANADITVMSGPGSTAIVTGTFKTAYCFIGERKYNYSANQSTDGVGRCHGAMMECVDNGHGEGMLSGVGEVTPYPWGDIMDNGIDDDCNGIVDDGAYFCPVNNSTISQGCCMPKGSSFAHPSLSDLKHQPNAYTLVKGSNSFVYLYASDGKRYVFTSKDVIKSWFTSFDGSPLGQLVNVCNTVNELSDVELASIPIGGNVTVRPGSYIVKIASDPKLYVVSKGKVLRWLSNQDLAEKFYPGTSAQRIHVVPEAFFTNYFIGPEVKDASNYDPYAEWLAADMETEAEAKQ